MPQDWEDSKMRGRCECERCRAGITTELHNDASHDQSLSQNFVISGKPLHIFGGTTKCARVMAKFFERMHGSSPLTGKKVVEVGSGTGLVGISLAVLGATVTLTDQEPLMELLDANVSECLDNKHNADTKVLLWEEPPTDGSMGPFDIVVGSDLIYAKEAHVPLSSTLHALCKLKPNTRCYLAVIDRFDWEQTFFELMAQNFTAAVVYQQADIRIYEFTLLPVDSDSTPTQDLTETE